MLLPLGQGSCHGRDGVGEERGDRDSWELQNPTQDQLKTERENTIERRERDRGREESNLYHYYQRMHRCCVFSAKSDSRE